MCIYVSLLHNLQAGFLRGKEHAGTEGDEMLGLLILFL